MFPALMMAVQMNDWVPARWSSNDPSTLDLVAETPVNCLLVEAGEWPGAFAAKAAARNIAVLGIVRPGAGVVERVRTAKEQSLSGIVLEGEFEDAKVREARRAAADLAVITMPSRRGIAFESGEKVLATWQGVWPGVRAVDDKDKAHAMPSGGPWIETNTGFLRYARSMHAGGFWMGVTPPAGQVIPIDRYFTAIGDAAMVGARWVVSLDKDFAARLMKREAAAMRDWKRIGAHLRFYEEQRRHRDLPVFGLMAVVQDASSGALLSGGVLDMIAVKHTPVRPVAAKRLSVENLAKAVMAVNPDPGALGEAQREALRQFQRGGGTVLNGPPDWKMPADSKDHLTVDEGDVKKLDEIWKEMNGMIARGRNMGVRLFNVSSMLSFLQASQDGKRAVLQLVNYSGYPVENVTAHILGRYKKAMLHTPEGKAKAIEPYDVDEGAATGLDIDNVPAFAALVLEQ